MEIGHEGFLRYQSWQEMTLCFYYHIRLLLPPFTFYVLFVCISSQQPTMYPTPQIQVWGLSAYNTCSNFPFCFTIVQMYTKITPPQFQLWWHCMAQRLFQIYFTSPSYHSLLLLMHFFYYSSYKHTIWLV